MQEAQDIFGVDLAQFADELDDEEEEGEDEEEDEDEDEVQTVGVTQLDIVPSVM